ncbi:MAG TPA: type II toxin-antitoxin system PemK/MazF family toxin [Desulfotomaculum sp.]|nr:type II toxin-antitoxin system PemK/MazF family toxin [Desulfotomaculum sp.]
MPNGIVRPGDIYRVSLEGTRHVLQGPHYAVIVSDEPFNYLSTVVIVPLSTGAKPASFRPEIILRRRKTRALPDQLRAIDKKRLKEYQENAADTPFFLALKAALAELFGLS